jgi:hypothetical protein
LRRRRFSFWRLRFFCDLMLAIAGVCSRLFENPGRLAESVHDPISRPRRL